MKKLLSYSSLIFLFLFISSCHTIKVATDYDPTINFDDYKTFAFYKKGIDQVAISDLDKRRILGALENTLKSKGFKTSENPDILVNIFTKEEAKVDVFNNNFGGSWGWGWNPWIWPGMGMGMQNTQVTTTAEGRLFIDFIDAKSKKLLWQGSGIGGLQPHNSPLKKQEIIQKFVTEILANYPPEKQ